MSTTIKAAFVGGFVGALVSVALVSFIFLAVDPRPLVAQASASPMTHAQMHQTMDTVHGPGTSQRMHEAMGPDAEHQMDQCVAMMDTVQTMQGMMGGNPSMMDGRNNEGMQSMMTRMMQ